MMKAFFGKMKKSIEEQMDCFLASCVAVLNVKHKTGSPTPQDQKHAKKFKKYMERLTHIIDGTSKKISNNPENLYKLAVEAAKNPIWLSNIIMEIEYFDFEDRKHIQLIITELFNQCPEIMTQALYPTRMEVVNNLLQKYLKQGMATFAGSLIRLYTHSSRLVDSLANIEKLRKLAELITNPDFNISSDAYETFKELFLTEREDDQFFDQFVNNNHKAIFELFDFLENDKNYFAKREGLKTQYMVLVKYESLRRIYTNDKDHLKMIMNLVLDQNKGIQYEAFLLLSLFILMPKSDEKVFNVLRNNRAMLIGFIEKFQNDRDDEDFYVLKDQMVKRLRQLE